MASSKILNQCADSNLEIKTGKLAALLRPRAHYAQNALVYSKSTGNVNILNVNKRNWVRSFPRDIFPLCRIVHRLYFLHNHDDNVFFKQVYYERQDESSLEMDTIEKIELN